MGTSASPFESIGAPTPRDEAPPGDKRARLRSFHLRATSTHHLELELEMDQSTRDARALIQSISRNIATRFDAHVDSVRHNPNPVLELRPAISQHTQADVDRLHKDTRRYMERLTTIDQAGISLDLILGADAPPSGEMSQQSSRDEMRRTRRDIPSSQFTAIRPSSGGPPTQPATEQHNTGFVLAIEPDPRDTTTSGADEAPQRVELAAQLRTTLRQGDFTDERLRREDAESALVDVVLRHPGYSDKNMAKVLTLLLSVDYSQALSIISLAPCVLARGTGQERARTMKSVIEGAGGKVVLVEPDTFAIA